MAHDNDTTIEGDKGLLQQPKRTQIEVVCWLIQHENIASALEYLRMEYSAAFAATEKVNFRVDAVFRKKETSQISSQGDALLAKPHILASLTDFFPNGFMIVQKYSTLIYVIDLGSRANLYLTGSGLLLPSMSFKSVDFPSPLRPTTPRRSPGTISRLRFSKSWRPPSSIPTPRNWITRFPSFGAGGIISSTSSSGSGAACAANAKYCSTRLIDLVRRALGLRRTHSSSRFRNL